MFTSFLGCLIISRMITDELTLAYLAGCLDSDGYFTIKRSTYHVRVRGDARVPTFSERIGLKQVTPVVADLLKSTFGGTRAIEKPPALKGKPLHIWQVTDKQAFLVAETLLPHLRIKKEQASLILDLRQLKGLPRSGLIVVEHLDRWGRMRAFRTHVMSPEDVAARQSLFEQIKALNDGRPLQAKLG